ncbi:MAG: hypothetical protein ACK46X_04350 [Candidatus Sericytochromatia bacterium]
MTRRNVLIVAPLLFALLTGCGQTPGAVAPLAEATTPSAAAAKAATGAGVTPAMVTAFAKLLDANGDGQLTKDEGFIELVGPEKTNRTLISNYYDAKYQRGEHVKALPVKTLTDSVNKGFMLSVRAIKGEVPNSYDTVAMSRTEIDRLADGLADVLEKSPLLKGGLMGGLPVRHIVVPHYLFRKGKDQVETWSKSKVRSFLSKQLKDKNELIKIHPAGQHADGAFVLEVYENPVI